MGDETDMDGGLRAPRPTDRRVAARPEQPVKRQPEPVVEKEVRPTYRTVSQPAQSEVSRWKRAIVPVIAVLVGILIGVGGWLGWSALSQAPSAVDSSKYQAVFFTNGQVYFGKLQTGAGDSMKLTDIYYLQTQTQDTEKDAKNPQQTTNDQGNVQLVKLGNEIHGPEDEMIIAKDQVLFYENLKSDGKVAQSIEQHKKNNK